MNDILLTCIEIAQNKGILFNESDLEKLTDDEQLRRISLMIYLGILDYLEEKSS